MKNAITRSWQTTISGLVMALPVLFMQLSTLWDGNAATSPDWAIVMSVVAGAFGLAAARDNGVRSESAGAR